jgi:PTS system nitrogen regulatory IIA component
VSQVFVLLVPEKATDLHLQLLSELAQMFSERTFRDKLSAATSAAELATLFREWQAT